MGYTYVYFKFLIIIESIFVYKYDGEDIFSYVLIFILYKSFNNYIIFCKIGIEQYKSYKYIVIQIFFSNLFVLLIVSP